MKGRRGLHVDARQLKRALSVELTKTIGSAVRHMADQTVRRAGPAAEFGLVTEVATRGDEIMGRVSLTSPAGLAAELGTSKAGARAPSLRRALLSGKARMLRLAVTGR